MSKLLRKPKWFQAIWPFGEFLLHQFCALFWNITLLWIRETESTSFPSQKACCYFENFDSMPKCSGNHVRTRSNGFSLKRVLGPCTWVFQVTLMLFSFSVLLISKDSLRHLIRACIVFFVSAHDPQVVFAIFRIPRLVYTHLFCISPLCSICVSREFWARFFNLISH